MFFQRSDDLCFQLVLKMKRSIFNITVQINKEVWQMKPFSDSFAFKATDRKSFKIISVYCDMNVPLLV